MLPIRKSFPIRFLNNVCPPKECAEDQIADDLFRMGDRTKLAERVLADFIQYTGAFHACQEILRPVDEQGIAAR